MDEHRYEVHVVINTGSGTHEVRGPRYDTEAEAQSDMNAIRQAQADGRIIDLPWLSTMGGNIVVANVQQFHRQD